jgi:hypothetical protein
MVKVYQFFDKCVKAVGDVKIDKYPRWMNGMLRYEMILICIFQMESSFWFILYHNIETYYQTPDPFHFQTLVNSFKM